MILLTSVWVTARYEEGTREQYTPLVEAALAEMEFPFGYRWTFGQWQERQREFDQRQQELLAERATS